MLTLSVKQQIDYVLLNTSYDVILASRFKDNVHVSPDVHLPDWVQHDLSVGLRYLYFAPTNARLISDAWNDFQRRLRYKIYFAFEKGVNGNYDPDYDVGVTKTATHKKTPSLPPWLELGLVQGRRFVNTTIGNIPTNDETGSRGNFKALAPKPGPIRQFLLEHNYVVTPTDKNLGIAVSKRDWIINATLKMLASSKDYLEISKIDADNIMSKKQNALIQIAKVIEGLPELAELRVDRFLKSKLTRATETHTYPDFYVIPKIHKKPTGYRPIVPCHSALMNPAAKFVSKHLKPLIQAAPTIIHGSKDLAIKLSKLQINTSRRWYIVTGDVVAYYPNVPLESCLSIVYDMWSETFDSERLGLLRTANDEYDELLHRRYHEVFKQCLRVGNTDLISQFDGKYYLQLRGLAMGVADSPDLANLYGCHFENKSGVIHDPSVIFYGRYIDDCIGLVYANSENEAINLISSKVKFDGCEITWECSYHSANFLDMTVYKDDRSRLQHKPFRKEHNHMERIPWISNHPYDVKRGTFSGELSRLATLSTTLPVYLGAVREVVALYIKRGYPADEVYKWNRTYIEERWKKRLAVHDSTGADEGVLVLKSTYNPAWNYFNAKELGDSIFNYWNEWYERAERWEWDMSDRARPFPPPNPDQLGSLSSGGAPGSTIKVCPPGRELFWIPDIRKMHIVDKRVIVSKKRGRNMFDLTSLWKKMVLQKLDERVLEEEHAPRRADPLDNLAHWQGIAPMFSQEVGSATSMRAEYAINTDTNIHLGSPRDRHVPAEMRRDL